MGAKYLAVVERKYLLDGRTRQLTARAVTDNVRGRLAAQHAALDQFGAELLKPKPTPLFDRLTAVHSLNRVDLNRTLKGLAPVVPHQPLMPAPPSSGRYKVLEAVGALVLDDDDIASSSLANVEGVTVYENRTFSAPSPPSALAAGANPWHLAQIGRVPGQALTGAGTLVGVLDTGIDATHAEFAGKTTHFSEFDPSGAVVGTAARDAGDHGTHVCGIISGAASGVAPAADLAVAAVLTTPDADGKLTGSTIQIATGLNWLLSTSFRPNQPGVDVINASLGIGVPAGGAARSGFNGFLQAIVRNALLAPGVLVVAAIGNDGRRGEGFHGSPGNYPEVLAVGATDQFDFVADFSDWDTTWVPPGGAPIVKPELCAPGDGVVSCVPGGGYRSMRGTSMAAPVVTGVAALLLQQTPALVGNPTQLRADLEAKATTPASPFPPNLGGAGRITL